jgi:hypothetical protein
LARVVAPERARVNGASVARTSSHSEPCALWPAVDMVSTFKRSESAVKVKVANCAARLYLSQMERSKAAVCPYNKKNVTRARGTARCGKPGVAARRSTP